MNDAVRNLEPKSLWNHFADLNAVPRPSKKEERVRAFMVSFGEGLGLPAHIDSVGNVIITKPASSGMEDRATVVLQSHLDMVHQKNNATKFDFDSEGIKMYVDGDWVKADGTTLGADNGIGVATIMAILASNDIAHPPLEALFTIDEETGMTGALGLKGGELTGKYLLNLDTEDDHELGIGCAGGVDVTVKKNYIEKDVPTGYKAYALTLNGLSGGHSGMDIHKGLGNANKLLNRVLWTADRKFAMHLSRFDGGGLRNAIPREAMAILLIRENEADDFVAFINETAAMIRQEYRVMEPGLKLEVAATGSPAKVMDRTAQKHALSAVYACPNGVYRMSPDIPGLVQTSNNVARVLIENGSLEVLCLTRSSVDSEKIDLAQAITANFENIGASVSLSGDYPGWTPMPDSRIVAMMKNLYEEMYNEEPMVAACHAGLECGIIGTNYPEMEMISFGPNIRGAHSPDEKVQISSVQKFWNFTLETLKRIPAIK